MVFEARSTHWNKLLSPFRSDHMGVYVVFASLILPALAAVGAKRPYLVSWFCGISSILVGMVLTLITDYPAGPVIVVAFVLMTIFWVAGTKHFSRR